MLDSAVVLLRERGAAGVTIDAVLAHSGTPRGSVYHHFPGGRNELILAAARQAGDYISAMVHEAGSDNDPLVALDRLVEFWKRALATTDHLAGCPVAALALSGQQDDPDAAELVREVFTRWQDNLSTLLAENGTPPDRAQRLATVTVAAVEGAIVLCRAHRDDGPLDDVRTEITPLLRAPAA